MPQSFVKDPHAVLDYSVDWSAWLDDGDTIEQATWTTQGVALETGPAPQLDGAVCTAWLSGGEPGQPASATCRITTAGGRIDERTLRLHITQR